MKTLTPDKMETLLNNLQERLEDARDEAIYSQTKDFHIRLEITEIKALISLLKGGWVKVENDVPENDQIIMVFGTFCPEVGEIERNQIGIVKWRDAEYSECLNYSAYAQWFTGIRQWKPILLPTE